MSWTEADGAALFRQQPDAQADDDAVVFDGGPEAMRRLRFPFEAPETNETGDVSAPRGGRPHQR